MTDFCAICNATLTNDEIIIIDYYSTLFHRKCFPIYFADLINDIGTYKNIQDKYQTLK